MMLSHAPKLLALPLCLLTLALARPGAAASFSFTELDDLPGSDFFSQAMGLSADGSVAVGLSRGGNGTEAFRWDGTMTGIGDLPTGVFNSRATGASTDGSMISGTGTISGPQAFLYDNDADTMIPLGTLPSGANSAANDISSDGLTVVGTSDSTTGVQAFRWQGSMVGLGALTPGGQSQGLAVSADGLVVVGNSESASGFQAFRWEGTMLGLGDLAGGAFSSIAHGVSPDGSIVVGSSKTGSADEAFIWQSGPGMTRLADLEDLGLFSTAYDVTDGGVAVGISATSTGPAEAVLWSASGTPSAIIDLLVANGQAAAVMDWDLIEAQAISDDGMTIAGWGINPAGDFEGWIATIPEPSTGLLLMLGLAMVGRRRR